MIVDEIHASCPVYLKDEGAGYYCPWAPIFCGKCTYEWMIGKQQKDLWRQYENDKNESENTENKMLDNDLRAQHERAMSHEPRTDII